MPQYKVTYFDGPGRAEVSRILLTVGGLEFEDVRISADQWKELKPKTPFGQIPTLEVDGEVICQQRAIEGYIARVIGRAGKTDLDFTKCQMVAECIEDMFKPLEKAFYEQDEEKKKQIKADFGNKVVHEFLCKFEKMISSKGYFITDEMSWPDVSLFTFLNNMEYAGVSQINLDSYANIQALMKQVRSTPKVTEWLNKTKK